MEAPREPPLVLVKVLEELASTRPATSYQDLCQSLCARLDLPQLSRLRNLLFHTACLDPGFPATLFKDKVKCPADNSQSKKIMVAADVVTMFNLIQMSGSTAKEKLPGAGGCREEAGGEAECGPLDCQLRQQPFGPGYPAGRRESRESPEFLPPLQPDFLLGVGEASKSRTASLDRLQRLGPFGVGVPRPCEMQRTYFPMNLDSELLSDTEPLPPSLASSDTFLPTDRPLLVPAREQRCGISSENFHLLVPMGPQQAGTERGASPRRKEPPRSPVFTHSFELPCSSPGLDPGRYDQRRVKHESLDDLQASTYFGPSPVPGAAEPRRCPGRPGRPSPWPAKSWSLNTDEVPDFECSFFSRERPEEKKRRYPSPGTQSPMFPTRDRRQAFLAPKDSEPVLYVATPGGSPSPMNLENAEPAKAFQEDRPGCGSRQLSTDTSSVSTQTEPLAPEPRGTARSSDRQGRKRSEESEAISDDISDIFRFLDDMSICGSSGILPSSCHNSLGSLSQLPKSDSDSPAGGQGHSEEELRSSVCRLLLRIGDIERRLESLLGVREEISQVLGKLNKLDQKMRQPVEPAGRAPLDLSEDEGSDSAQLPHTHTPAREDTAADWGCSEGSSGHSTSLHVAALKRSLLARPSSRSLTENSATESKIASISNSPRGWRPVTHATHAGRGGLGGAEGKDWHRKSKETDRQHDAPRTGFLVEQVFSPHAHPASLRGPTKGGSLYANMRLAEVKRQPPWALEEHVRSMGAKGKLAALDLQTQESLNPNNLDYWMEGLHTPGYDSLLKHKEAEFRRARGCKLAALITAATCTVLLVIVVPLCTMKS
ncbi:major intrinsically disordered Notch2-binding receptor 1 [Sorex araneus]|uniref:major intrinsically disordered Notch2-binding receptor 1 n=1 Tax=Sorex araneus TaxID=42254 RepID=UPI002433E52A|nr:major intrinsically disordered Notch2-binding receptor 1 [Sorex araneus]XP_054997815.1 major intrinsically disordered Notch2-binding receptor 1 [Sorex araneus]XP_054997816.1 major intrinsically disordered Notch2-binding receptor 1 [Sorex araneus]XP_054997817.1 major intrinsically disordered Notch2-binding receptor 1 [Sorex araneus]